LAAPAAFPPDFFLRIRFERDQRRFFSPEPFFADVVAATAGAVTGAIAEDFDCEELAAFSKVSPVEGISGAVAIAGAGDATVGTGPANPRILDGISGCTIDVSSSGDANDRLSIKEVFASKVETVSPRS
jgi:hypothetical protein